MSDRRRRTRAGPRRRGAALLMVICVLGVLVLMVGAFAAVTRIERAASANYVDGERARFLAWSGVERAKFELRRAPSTPLFPLQWAAYEPANGATTLPKLEQARDPSFRLKLDPLPAAFDSADPTVVLPPWPSGVVGASYYVDTTNPAFGGDYYVLKVEDTNSKIALNDGNPHLPKMLDTLARFRGLSATDIGSRIVGAMPADGYSSVDELRRVLTPDEFREVAPFVAVHSFIDQRVIEMGEQYTSSGSGTVTSRPATRARQPRAPINVNTAPLPVLVALFHGISWGGTTTSGPTEAVDYARAQALAQGVKDKRDQLLQASGAGFQKWSEFYEFLLKEASLTPTLAAAVLANCNPNTDTNKLVPDLSMYRPVDKLDLRGATTELTFAPGGIYEIESLGVILAPDAGTHVARVIAQSKVKATVRVFERMVDRMQDDFEADRKDKGPRDVDATSPLPNLRDMTTLPEFRNAGDGTLALAADWDGQVTFNVITSQEVSLEGAFLGFLGTDLSARPTAGGAPIPNTGTARGQVNETVASSPDMKHGSDLHPFGARLGAGDRSLAYAQDKVVAVVHREVPQSEIIMTDGHGNYASTLATIPSWTYDAVDAAGFELWFKPDHPPLSASTTTTTTGASRQVLLEWESGAPRMPGSPDPVVPGGTVDMSSFVSDVHDENVQHYLDAVAAGGPGPGGFPDAHVAGSGATVPPPPPEYFFGSPLGTNGALPWNVSPYPGGDAQAALDAEKYAQMLDQWFADKFGDLVSDMFRDADATNSNGITWGAKAKLTVYLDPAGIDPVSPLFRLGARFTVEQKNEEYSSTSNAYVREWVSDQTVRAGTWHHMLFSFYAVPPPDATRVPPQHTNLFLDGRRVETTDADNWPTEIHAQARIAKRVVDTLNAGFGATGEVDPATGIPLGGIEIEFDVEDYRVPVEIPRGNLPVSVGADVDGNRPFKGLADNVIFQGNWPKFFPDVSTTASPGRFDLWRPSLARVVNQGGDDHHLRFTKRTQGLEWDQPIRVLSYAWTAWKHNDVMGGALSLGLV